MVDLNWNIHSLLYSYIFKYKQSFKCYKCFESYSCLIQYICVISARVRTKFGLVFQPAKDMGWGTDSTAQRISTSTAVGTAARTAAGDAESTAQPQRQAEGEGSGKEGTGISPDPRLEGWKTLNKTSEFGNMPVRQSVKLARLVRLVRVISLSNIPSVAFCLVWFLSCFLEIVVGLVFICCICPCSLYLLLILKPHLSFISLLDLFIFI